MRRLVAAPDKFRGTATARAAADAVARGADAAGWSATTVPMSDGGEGFLDVLGGQRHDLEVTGPLGRRVEARWSLLDDGTAVVESAQAAGRPLLLDPRGDDPLRATTYGVGELLAAAVAARPRRVVVGVGGTATTDGGLGCVTALEDLGCALAVDVVVACDVRIPFCEAAAAFGPQKGATPDQVATLTARLERLAGEYEERFGRDVRDVPGAGAGGGLAGGLVALGARAVAGAVLVADLVGLDGQLEAADLVVTGEGRLDLGTLEGKVVATVLARRPALPALVVAGQVEQAAAAQLAASRPGRTEVVALDDHDDAPAAIAAATRRALEGL